MSRLGIALALAGISSLIPATGRASEGFHRLFDFYMGLGYPDLFHACIEAHPGAELAIEGCSSGIGLHTSYATMHSLHAGPRWPLNGDTPANEVRRGHRGWTWGPMAGLRYGEFSDGHVIRGLGVDAPDEAILIDFTVALQGTLFNPWLPHLGFTMRLDLGTSFLLDVLGRPDQKSFGERFAFPLGGKFSLGLSF